MPTAGTRVTAGMRITGGTLTHCRRGQCPQLGWCRLEGAICDSTSLATAVQGILASVFWLEALWCGGVRGVVVWCCCVVLWC